ncbi:MAG: accessory gene regulator B family protein [Clostridia bacterium]|nr:accessory gene regulator B family protein [Clostridia bacterium]MBR2175667.1 accessory gene regulator B family protein [Clostridia bacterium]
MFNFLAERLTVWLISKNAVDHDDKELYKYGINRMLMLTLMFISTIFLEIILGGSFQGLIFLVLFILLRSYAGGFHVSKPIGCYILTMMIITTFLLVIKFVEFDRAVLLIVILIADIVIAFLSPIEAKNKPLDSMEKIIYKKRTLINLIFQTSMCFLSLKLNISFLYLPIVFAHFSIGISLIVAYLRKMYP